MPITVGHDPGAGVLGAAAFGIGLAGARERAEDIGIQRESREQQLLMHRERLEAQREGQAGQQAFAAQQNAASSLRSFEMDSMRQIAGITKAAAQQGLGWSPEQEQQRRGVFERINRIRMDPTLTDDQRLQLVQGEYGRLMDMVPTEISDAGPSLEEQFQTEVFYDADGNQWTKEHNGNWRRHDAPKEEKADDPNAPLDLKQHVDLYLKVEAGMVAATAGDENPVPPKPEEIVKRMRKIIAARTGGGQVGAAVEAPPAHGIPGYGVGPLSESVTAMQGGGGAQGLAGPEAAGRAAGVDPAARMRQDWEGLSQNKRDMSWRPDTVPKEKALRGLVEMYPDEAVEYAMIPDEHYYPSRKAFEKAFRIGASSKEQRRDARSMIRTWIAEAAAQQQGGEAAPAGAMGQEDQGHYIPSEKALPNAPQAAAPAIMGEPPVGYQLPPDRKGGKAGKQTMTAKELVNLAQ